MRLVPIEPWRDILLAHLGELPYDSFVEKEKGLKAYILTEDLIKQLWIELCDSLDAQVSFDVKDKTAKLECCLGI